MSAFMNRIWFVGVLCFCSINLIGVAESITAEQDFEAVVKQGYNDFLDRVGQEKFKELGLEDPIETQRLKKCKDAEIRERKLLFDIRKSMTDECINTYKQLTEKNLHYWDFYTACMRIFPLYDKRQEEKKGLEIVSLQNMYKIITENRGGIRQHMSLGEAYVRQYYGIITSESKQGVLNALKDDVLETMEIYKELYGQQHPRWEEFSKM